MIAPCLEAARQQRMVVQRNQPALMVLYFQDHRIAGRIIGGKRRIFLRFRGKYPKHVIHIVYVVSESKCRCVASHQVLNGI
ncbi:hypothetical protein FUT69_04120 [Xylella taiwanensis]|uniref:Transposase n=1 Tax=Xylella taiwanensis TaxID=1444770 RepID=A0ABS8TUA9_9GAMM|nr:hypothetical protein [Xylella taiwanensis]MCD8455307.1 hypothetical protein [Xylella taiwanensis]MCD8464354.1 hypothetical protein [Xylella taiwanensis]MCD8468087.1 hypothetical protein [Xylella taiwanensis]MCD8469573.1 hypothetical protein [Xylella taiwanensis]MCD8472636.1 hypothetical protein [Xylella taiwanensis]